MDTIAVAAEAGSAVADLAVVVDALLVDLPAVAGLTATAGQVRGALAAVVVQQRRLDAVRLRLVKASVDADAREGVGSGRRGRTRAGLGAGTVSFLADQLHESRARAHADVAAADLLDADTGDLPELGKALAAGATSRDHVGVAVRVLGQVPTADRRARGAEIDTALTEHCTTYDPATTATLGAHLLDALHPDGRDRFDPDAHERRALHLSTDSTGMVLTRGQHDPVTGAFLRAAIDAVADLDRALPVPPGIPDMTGSDQRADLGVGDLRDLGTRRHDALADLVRAGAHTLARGDTTGRIGDALARVAVVTTPDQLTASPDGTDDTADAPDAVSASTIPGHGPISRGLLHRLACDSVLDRIVRGPHGQVLAMATLGRTATPAMVRALVARDGGCSFPGCGRPPSLCDAHHVTWWSRGGPTTIDNLTLLCSHHHTLIHTQTWGLRMRDGVPWYRPPAASTWTRNSFTDAVTRTRRLATALSHTTALNHAISLRHVTSLRHATEPSQDDTG